MPYDVADPRATLTDAGPARPSRGVPDRPQYFRLADLSADEESDLGGRTWLVRSQNCCIAYTAAAEGDRLIRTGQPDEYVALFISLDAAAAVRAGADQRDVKGPSVVLLPPGDSEIEVRSAGVVIRLFSNASADLLARCRN